MFKSVVRGVFPSLVTKGLIPDYFSFERTRPAGELDNEASTIVLPSSTNQSIPNPTIPSLPFYDYLFGDSQQQNAQDQLSEYVAEKLRQVIQAPDALLNALPVMPTSVTTAMQILQNDNFNVLELLQIIEKEPSMAADLVKLANTNQYKRGDKEVTDLHRAFMFMGAEGLVKGVVEVYLKQYAVSPSLYFRQFGQKIWQHSDSTAQLAKSLAQKCLPKDEVDTVYFVALLRNLGAMVIFQLMVDAFKYVDPDATPSSAHFKQLIATESISLVTRIAQHWQLPKTIIDILMQQNSTAPTELSGAALSVYEGNLISEAKALLESRRWQPTQYEKWLERKLFSAEAKQLVKDNL